MAACLSPNPGGKERILTHQPLRLDRTESETVANLTADTFIALLPTLREIPGHLLWSSYDEDADVLYVSFRKDEAATDSEMTDDDLVVRYQDDEVVGFTVLNASQR